MSMPIFKSRLLLLPLLIFSIATTPGCKKKIAYTVNEVDVHPPNANKSKQKTEGQYISILYANLFQKALSANELVEITNVIESMGDKELAHEVIISNLMNEPDVLIPSDSLMKNDVDKFIDQTYERFLVRLPSEAERTWFRNFIASHPDMSAEMVYFSFALSNEYLFY